MTRRCLFTGPGWYRLLWRSHRDPPGTTRVVWIESLADPERPDFLGVWHKPAVVGDPMLAIARIDKETCERNLVHRIARASA